jgi:hypothetical protein
MFSYAYEQNVLNSGLWHSLLSSLSKQRKNLSKNSPLLPENCVEHFETGCNIPKQ